MTGNLSLYLCTTTQLKAYINAVYLARDINVPLQIDDDDFHSCSVKEIGDISQQTNTPLFLQ